MNNIRIKKSTIRSAIIVPKALSNGTFLYLVSSAALEISPEREWLNLKNSQYLPPLN